MSVPQHIVDQLEDYLDGSLDEAGRNRLVAWTSESEANAQDLAQWFMREVELLEAARVADLCAVFEGLTFDSRGAAPAETQPPAERRNRKSSAAALLAVAAMIVGVLAVAYSLATAPKDGPRRRLAHNSRAANSVNKVADAVPSPAILGRLANCVWGAGMQPLRVGQDIIAGSTIDIQSGLAQLYFESGAEIVLQGPCRMRVTDAMLCNLEFGSVSAEVPPRAAGFTIRGPAAEVIDLGTRFGFSVGTAGKSEVHVFQGEVISRQLDNQGGVVGDEIHLTTNQAILFPGEKQQAQRLAADEAKFALEVRPLWLHDEIEPLSVDRNIALWLRAAHGVQMDAKNKVVAWQDLAIGDNQVANDAFQPEGKARPRFIRDALRGQPALRFDGQKTFLTTTPMTTTDNQTIIIVFQYAEQRPGAKRAAGQIVNYNGPPSRFLPDVHSPGVLQLGEKISGWNGPVTSIAAKAFVGRDSAGTDVSTGIVVSKPLGTAGPHVVAYTYNMTENSATLYIDGKPVANASAPTCVAVTSRKVVGKHGIFDQWYFRGDLGELIIYNTALSPAEVESLSLQLMTHYGVSPKATGAPRQNNSADSPRLDGKLRAS